MYSIPSQLNEDQLSRYLSAMIEKILDKIQEKRPDLTLSSDDKKNLAQNIAKAMLQGRDELSREDALENNPKFIHKLTMSLVMASKSNKYEDLFEKIKELFKSKDIKDEKDLKNKLTPAEMKQLTMLQEQLRELQKAVFKDLKELNLIKPSMKNEEMEQHFDPNSNLLGLVDSHEAGGIAAVVQVFIGNFFGVTNQNPYYEESQSQLSLQDKVDDTQFGDPLGLNNAARENYAEIGGDLVDQVQSLYRHQETMKPTPQG